MLADLVIMVLHTTYMKIDWPELQRDGYSEQYNKTEHLWRILNLLVSMHGIEVGLRVQFAWPPPQPATLQLTYPISLPISLSQLPSAPHSLCTDRADQLRGEEELSQKSTLGAPLRFTRSKELWVHVDKWPRGTAAPGQDIGCICTLNIETTVVCFSYWRNMGSWY